MATRDYLKHFVSNTRPTNATIGDEWYNPVTNLFYKNVALNGTTPTFNPISSSLTIQNSGTTLNNNTSSINFIGFTMSVDAAGNVVINPPTAAAAGATTNVQYNNSGSLAGSSNFTWNNGTQTLGVTGFFAANQVRAVGGLNSTVWSTTGPVFNSGGTITDVSGTGGTVPVRTGNSFNPQTWSSSVTTTITNAATLYVDAPIASTNTTFTNAYGLYNASNQYVGGNLGINTTPTNRLSVLGGAISVSSNTTYAASFGNALASDFTIGSDASFVYLQSWNSKPIQINNQGNNLLLNPSSGSVGIGNVNPQRTLQINAASAGIRLEETSAGAKRLEMFVSSDGIAYIAANQSAQTIQIQTVGTSRITIDATGNVSVGTTSQLSSARLSVADATVKTSAAVNTTFATATGGSNDLQLILSRSASGTGAYWSFQSVEQGIAYRDLVLQQNGGNVGMGTTSPSSPLTISAASGDGVPLLRLIATSAPNAVNWLSSAMNSSLTTTNTTALHLFGQAQTAANSGYIGFRYAGGSGSLNNHITIGLYGFDNLLNILGNGNVGIATTTPRNPFDVTKNGFNASGNWYEISRFVDGSSNKGLSLGYDNTAQLGLIAGHTNSGLSGIAFWSWNGSAWGERMRIETISQTAPNLLVGQTTYTNSGVSGSTTVASPTFVVGGQSAESMYIRRAGQGLYQQQTTVSGSNTGHIQLNPYGGNVMVGGSGATSTNKFEVQGTAGQLFSVTDSMTGTLFSANDISGIPSIEVLDTGLIKLAQYGGFVAYGISIAQTSVGSTQATALAITRPITDVTTVASGTGVILPVPTIGTRILIRNSGALSLNVYPNSGAQINSLGANVAFTHFTGSLLEFVSFSTTQWYTMNATFAA